MPPASRNHRTPTAGDTPAATAAASLDEPAAIAAQNRRRSSRRATPGRPGDRNVPRPARSERRFRLPIATSSTGVLRRPLESAQYVSIRYTERLAEAGIEPSVGSVGDSYDNALAETINGLFKAEVIRRRGPWRSFEAVEFATLEWVEWFNNRRLLEPIGDIPPAEAEARYYAQLEQQAVAA
jgi:Integrase core domain